MAVFSLIHITTILLAAELQVTQWYTGCMDTALIVVGLLVVGILLIGTFAYLSDPKEIDEEEETQVRRESPQDLERDRFEETVKDAQSNADDIAFYSPGESAGDE